MMTFTLNRSVDAGDFLFVALNDSSFTEWEAGRNREIYGLQKKANDSSSFLEKLRKYFK